MSKSNQYVAIMAGGVGSRFWPGSRSARPKQFLDMLNIGKSLLRMTYERFLPVIPAENIFVVTNKAYKKLVRQQIPELTDLQILCEPSRNNTAPSIAWTAFKLHQLDPTANFVVASSDHVVLKEDVFREKIVQALHFAEHHDALITLGVQPHRPDTGYGYIQFGEQIAHSGIHRVLQFTEKPNLATAERFVASGEYLWNAGIFIWKTRTVLAAFAMHAPDIFKLFQAGEKCFNTAAEQRFINKNYPKSTNISIDYAILEKATNVFTLPCDLGWSDLGTWASLHAECPKDEHHNVLQGKRIIADQLENCLVHVTGEKLVVLKNLTDFIVVDDNDVLLVWPKSEEQLIKQLVEKVKKEHGDAFL